VRFDLGSWPQQLLVLVAAFKGRNTLALAVALVLTVHPLFACGWVAVVVGTYDIVGVITEVGVLVERAATGLAFSFGVQRFHIRARDVTNTVVSVSEVPLTACSLTFVLVLVIRG
jgi:hypothetical protein